MTDRWDRVTELFNAARLLGEPGRSAFLQAACADDPELRADVEQLLVEDINDGFLVRPTAQGLRDIGSLDAPLAPGHLPISGPVMSLAAGARLGPYEILAPLGAGGMGEVYRARDPRLNRLIAIKVLPGAAATDAERRERFEREAHAIAALNHPNIVTIYSVEHADGQFFITMELVAGRSLAEMMPKSGLPLDRLLRIAIPVADAIAAAHQKGITHRDLKPANIMLGEGEHDGRVKVLDFGLAKLAEAPVAAAAATALPTAPITDEGRIVGTVAYMSPEQAEGKPVDARSDLFSLGVVLYEMATGRRPFTGDTSISIISSIIKDTPKSVTEVNAALPRDLGRIVRRALVKDPTRRYQTAADLRNDLEELKASLDSGELSTASAPPAAAHRRQAQAWRWFALGLALVAIVVVVLNRFSRRADQPQAVAAPQMQMLALTSTGNASRAVLSPDGKYVVYIQQEDGNQTSVWVRQISGNSAVRIVPPEPQTRDVSLAVTPDGSFVDCVRSTPGQSSFALWRVPFLGGALRKIVDDVDSAPGWSRDGKRMAFLTRRVPASMVQSVIVANADGANAGVLTTRTLPEGYGGLALRSRPDVRPIWMPDGQSIVVVGFGPAYGHLVAVNVNTGAETVLGDNLIEGSSDAPGWSIALAADGHSFIASLPAGEMEPQQLLRIQVPGGRITKLTNDLNQYGGASLAGETLVTTRWQTRSGLWTADADGNSARAIGTDLAAELGPLAWADETRVVYAANLAGGPGLWLHDLATGVSQLIVPGGTQPSTTADGRTIVFNRSRDGKSQLWRADSNGTHAALVLGVTATLPAVTPDGSRVLFVSQQSGIQSPWIVNIDGTNGHELLRMRSNPDVHVSPDGRFVAFPSGSDRDGVEVAIAPISGGDPLRRIRVVRQPTGPLRLGWTPDGLGLSYADAAQTNIWVQPIAGGTPRQLTHFIDRRIVGYAWSHDGKRLALARATTTSDVVMLKGVK
jgi:serine/threonine protein kinase/Tol biopolymer transport system component